jgi:hypothetical protein
MRFILGYALVVAFSTVMFFWFIKPEIDRAGQQWQAISDAVTKATGE